MKIKSVKLENIRCFEELKLNFVANSGIINWILILGDNGVGKSTILRSIALGLTEESGASGLLDELGSDWIRKGHKDGKIKIEIEPFPGCKENAYIETLLTEDKFKEVKVRQTVSPKSPKSFNWDDLFVCGYGAGRGISSSESYQEYIITDTVYTLFKYTQPLQNPELNLRRINSLGISERDILSRIEKILMLNDGSITLDFSGIKVSGFWGEKMPLDALGDGYRSSLVWIMDLYGWKILAEGSQNDIKNIKIDEMSGIVLLDEIEQHLHPIWQRRIIKLLKEQFPNIQFIATTHAPLCVIGTTDLKDEECKIAFLCQEEDTVCLIESNKPPRGKRIDQILTSYMFGMTTTSDDETKHQIEKYSRLLSKKALSTEEKKDVQMLKDILNDKFSRGETELERKISKAVFDVFESEPTDSKIDPDAVDFEIKRQLKELFNFEK